MVDSTKKIEVELALKKDKFEQELKSVAKSGSGLRSLEKRLGKERTQAEKSILAQKAKLEGPQAQKRNAAVEKNTLKFEKARLNLIEKQVKETKKLQDIVKATWRKNARFSKTLGGAPTRGGLGGAARMLGGMGLGAIVGAAGMAVGTVSSQIQQGYGRYSQYRQAQGALTGTGARRQPMDAAAAKGVKRGYTVTETMQQALAVAKATGNASAVTTAQDLSRTTGMGVEESAGFMGQLTRGGKGFGGKAGVGGKKELEKAIAAGFASGLDRARMPEFIKGVGQLVEMQSGRQGGDVSSVGFSKMLAAMGMTKQSGMMGTRGANVLAQLNESMVNPGGGSQGQAIMLQAYGFGKPGGTTSYYDARRRQQEGAKPENVKAMFDEFARQYGGGERQILAMEKTTGLSITQLEGLREAIGNKDDKKIEEILKKSKPVADQSLEELQFLGKHIVRLAGLDERLKNIGEKSQTQIELLQDMVNEMVDKLVPAAVGTMGLVSGVYQALRNEFGTEDNARLKTYENGADKPVLESYLRDQAQFALGNISAEESIQRGKATLAMQTAIAASASSGGTKYRAGKNRNSTMGLESAWGQEADPRSVRQGILSGKFSFNTDTDTGKLFDEQARDLQEQMVDARKTLRVDDDAKVLRKMRQDNKEFGPMFTALMTLYQQQGSSIDELVWFLNQGDVKSTATPKTKGPATKDPGRDNT